MIVYKKIIQFSIIVISLLGLMWFLIPFILYRILNIGNGTGIIISLVLFIYGITMQRIHVWVVSKFSKRIGRIVLRAVGAVIGSTILLVMFFSACMIKTATHEPTANPTVIVLGCRVYGERASLMLTERLEAAYRYLSDNKAAFCILSGGQGAGEDITEAECMYRYLVQKGIEPKRLLKEENSTSTRENIAFSKEIIEKNNLNRNIAIVTNEFHQYRAGKVAKDLHLNSAAIPAKTAWWLFPTYYVRELYGIIYEIIF